MGEGTLSGVGDTDRNSHHGEPLDVPFTVRRLDMARFSIFGVIKRRYDAIKRLDQILARGFDQFRIHNTNEVVSADVAHEIIPLRYVANDIEHETSRDFDDLIASTESVFVVKGFEMIQVGISQSKRDTQI